MRRTSVFSPPACLDVLGEPGAAQGVAGKLYFPQDLLEPLGSATRQHGQDSSAKQVYAKREQAKEE